MQLSSRRGTALAGVDYTARSGTLTFGPGVTSQSSTVPILNPGRTSGSAIRPCRPVPRPPSVGPREKSGKTPQSLSAGPG